MTVRYEVLNWDKDGNLIDHETYTSAWELFKDWPYGCREIDVAVIANGQTRWTTVEDLKREYEENDNG